MKIDFIVQNIRLHNIICLHLLSYINHSNCQEHFPIISNLNDYIFIPFEGCLIHIINYKGIDLNNSLHPWVLSRYYVQINDTNSYDEKTPLFTRQRIEDTIRSFLYKTNDTEIPYLLLSAKVKWTCVGHFLLLPPLLVAKSASMVDDYGLIIPNQYTFFWNNLLHHIPLHTGKIEFWANQSAADVGSFTKLEFTEKVNYRRYIILVTDVNPLGKYKKKRKESSPMSNFHKGVNHILQASPWTNTHLLIYKVDKMNDNVSNVIKTWIVCMQCNLIKRKLLHIKMYEKNITPHVLDKFFERYDQEVSTLPFHWTPIFDINNEVLELRKRKTRNILMSTKTSLEFVSSFRLWNMTRYLKSAEMSKDLFMFMAFIIPNRTIGPSQVICEDYSTNRNINQESCRNQNTMPKFNLQAAHSISFLRVEEPFTFLSCGRTILSTFSFHGFINAFDIFTWAFTILCYFGLTGLIILLSKNFSLMSDVRGVFVGVKILLEQGDNYGGDIGSLTKHGMVWICSGWVLGSLILSNLYRGENITSITAPWNPYPLVNFSQLTSLNYSVYSRETKQSTWLVFIQLTEFEKHMMSGRIFEPLGKQMDKVKENWIRDNLMKTRMIRSHHMAKQWMNYPMKYFKIFEPCNEIALVGWKTDLDWMNLRLLRNVKIKDGETIVSFGKEELFWRKLGWSFTNVIDPRIPRRLRGLNEYGFAKKIDEIHENGLITDILSGDDEAKDDKKGTNETSGEDLPRVETVLGLKITGNMAVIFFLFSGAVSTSISAFFVEHSRVIIVRARFVRNEWMKAFQSCIKPFEKRLGKEDTKVESFSE